MGLSFYQVDCATLYVMTDAAESEDMGLFKRGIMYNHMNMHTCANDTHEHTHI